MPCDSDLVSGEMNHVLCDSGISDVLSDACEVALSAERFLSLVGLHSPGMRGCKDRFVWRSAIEGPKASTKSKCTRGSRM